jgi:putative hydrolase of the HAD superfamily
MAEKNKYLDLIRRFSTPLLPRTPEKSVLEIFLERCGSRGAAGQPYKAVVFDIYGTLFVSGSGDIGTLDSGLVGIRFKSEDLRDLLSPYADPPDLPRLRKMFSQAVKKRHNELLETTLRGTEDVPEIRVEELWADLLDLGPEQARDFSLRFELAVNPVYPMPGLEDLITRLRALDIYLGIVSNAQFFTPLLFEAFIGKSLEALGFLESLCVYSYKEGCGKPSPGLFTKVAGELRRLGVEPEGALFVGNDMLNDVWAAGKAGLGTALFAGDLRSLRLRKDDSRCEKWCPDHVVHDLREIGDLVSR